MAMEKAAALTLSGKLDDLDCIVLAKRNPKSFDPASHFSTATRTASARFWGALTLLAMASAVEVAWNT
jgi:hypothetical protein